jgi:hypothetical protein
MAFDFLAAPPAVEVSVASRLPPDHLADRLRGAAAGRRTSSPGAEGPYVVQLSGSVRGRAVDVIALPRRADGHLERQLMPLAVIGRIEPAPDGSIMTVAVSVPATSRLVWAATVLGMFALLALTGGWLVLLMSGGFFALVAFAWFAITRWSQRFSLRAVPALEALLAEIARGG